ncbi:MAG: cyclic pyranopterin monophosphate synthase MoaC [Actinomycetota bacterium]
MSDPPDPAGQDAARIVEVGGKEATAREAVAEATVEMSSEACRRLLAGTPKGNPLEAARIAGIMAVKRTPDLLPFCHPVAVTGAEVEVRADPEARAVRIRSTVRATDRTGVEMEALTAAAVAALSIYDTVKGYERTAQVTGIRLLEKRGGKSGDYRAEG